jgi:hypothetical protein
MDYISWLSFMLHPLVGDGARLAVIVFGLMCMAFGACILFAVDAPEEFADYEGE